MKNNNEKCSSCGGRSFIDATDNLGQQYRGCARCRIVVDDLRVGTKVEVSYPPPWHEGKFWVAGVVTKRSGGATWYRVHIHFTDVSPQQAQGVIVTARDLVYGLVRVVS